MSARYRCGDHVHHRPTDETWMVAWCDDERLAWAGWPDGTALVTDCDMVRAATYDEHRDAVAAWQRSGGQDSRKARVLEIYGEWPASPASPHRRTSHE